MSIFSKRLLEILSGRDMTQSELAKIANTTDATISRYINEEREPKIEIVMAIASALNVSFDYLLGGNGQLPYDEETIAAMEEAKNRPELQTLFSLSRNATREDVERTIDILEALKKTNPNM